MSAETAYNERKRCGGIATIRAPANDLGPVTKFFQKAHAQCEGSENDALILQTLQLALESFGEDS